MERRAISQFLESTARNLSQSTREDASANVALGLGIPFEKLSQDLGGFYEIIDRDAVASDAFSSVDTAVLFNHDQNKILGRYSARTLRVEKTDEGWMYEFDLPDNTIGRDLAVSLERGDIYTSSFGFTLDWSNPEKPADNWEERYNNKPVRRIMRIARVYDFSPVTFAAYGIDTSVALRSLQELKTEQMPPVVANCEAIDYFLRYHKIY